MIPPVGHLWRRVLPVFDLVDRYATVTALSRAYAVVAHGSVAGCRRLLSDPALRVYRLRNTVVLVKESLDTVWWFLGPAALLAAFLTLLVSGWYGELIVRTASALAYTVLNTVWCVRRGERRLRTHQGADARAEPPYGSPGVTLVPAFLAQPLLHWAGPLRHLFRVLRGRPIVLGKTER